MSISATDGVNVVEGDSFSAFAGAICRQSYSNSPFVSIQDYSKGHFRGPRTWHLCNLRKGCEYTAAPDGIGTKVILIDALKSHTDAGRDLLAMCCGDITREGGLPLLFLNVLDVATLGEEGDETNNKFRSQMRGLGEAAKEEKIVLYKGETAEVSVCVGSEIPDSSTRFNWAGTAIGVNHPGKMILGDNLAEGQVIIALRELGFRSNGISSVRKAFALRFGEHWYKSEEAKPALEQATQPSTLYDHFLTMVNGWYQPDFIPHVRMHLIVHVTGGAIRSKLAEDYLFRLGLSARLDELWEPPQIMRECAAWRGMNDETIYETWNGGQGVLVVLDERHANSFTLLAAQHGIEAKVCGRITKEPIPQVTITSKFSGQEIVYSS